jgi:L-alanine-DL-glutamate epimerase-like enolase superfamily enzyme
MRIRSVEAIPVRVPRSHVARSAFGQRTHTDAGLVRIRTDNGPTGWGEISLVWGREGAGLCAAVRDLLAPVLIGEDPTQVARLDRRMEAVLPGRQDAPARAAVEMALLDLIGHDAGLPVHALLGGRFRDRIPLSYSVHMDTPEQMRAAALRQRDDGFTTLKVKIGRDWAEDRAAVEAVRDGVGSTIRLRVDVNEAWRSVAEAADRIGQLDRFGLELVEQPLPAADVAGLAELRTRVGVPIAADEAVWTPEDAWRVLHARAADAVNVYVSEAGGLLPARTIVELARLAGVRVWIGSMPELGVGTAAIVHLAATVPELDLACDACGVLYHEADLLTAPLRVTNGHIEVPTSPGLGVEIDEEELRRWRIDR